MLSFLVLCGWIVGASKGFLFENTPVPANMFPGLPEIAKKQTGLALDVRIIVENPSDQQSMMALDGLSLALSGDEIRISQNDRGDDDKAFSLPGDRTPHLRSGRHAVRVESSPGFVGMNGHQKVDVSNHGGWELVWKEGDLTGNLICGICVNEEVERNSNGAKLPIGTVYLSFLVWTRELYEGQLENVHASAKRAEAHHKRSLRLKEEAENTSNLLQRARLVRSSNEENTSYERSHRAFQFLWSMTPLDSDLIELSSDLLVLSKGTSWTNNFKKGHRRHDRWAWQSGGMVDDGYCLLGKAEITKATTRNPDQNTDLSP